MEDQIPQLFKVRWLNSTLKYIKNDNQLVMEYPEMPARHVEYLHNSIWQPKKDVGLSGFKSMYAPVWEAMRIFSLKYRFKVSAIMTTDGEMGQLVIEKMPKRDVEDQETVKQLIMEKTPKRDVVNQEPAKVQYQGSDSDDTGTETSGDSSPSKAKKRTKLEREFFINQRKILESISPKLLRKDLQNILNFLTSEADASVTFSDLAPVEATFMENFLDIYKERKAFKPTLSPECNDLLDNIHEHFKLFSKQCKLEVSAAKCNVNSNKREVRFLKVPSYTRAYSKQQIKKSTDTPSPRTVNKAKMNESASSTLPKSNSVNASETMGMNNFKISIPNTAHTSERTIDKRDVKLPRNIESIDNCFTHNDIVTTDDNMQISNKEHLKRKTDATLSTQRSKKPIKKAAPVLKNSGLSNEKAGPTNKPTSGSKAKNDNARRAELLKAMSTPMESDKGLRMMQVMGWKGGALGARGDGLLEPLIPAINIVPGKGLGHVTKTSSPAPPAPRPPNYVTIAMKRESRLDFLKTILSLIQQDMSVTSVSYSVQGTTKKERSCYKNIVQMFNTGSHFTLGKNETDVVKEIGDIMANQSELFLDLEFSDNLNELTLTKSMGRVVKTKAKKKKKKRKLLKEMSDTQTCGCGFINYKYSPEEFKICLCTTILDFIQNDATEKEVKFDEVLTDKYMGYVNDMCGFVNKRVRIPYAPLRALAVEILQKTNDCYLNVQFDMKLKRSFVLRKLYYQNRFTNSASSNRIEEYIKSTTEQANNEITTDWLETADSNLENHTNSFTDKCSAITSSYIFIDAVSNSIVTNNDNKVKATNATNTFIGAANILSKSEAHAKTRSLNKEINDVNDKFKPGDHEFTGIEINDPKKNIVRLPLRVILVRLMSKDVGLTIKIIMFNEAKKEY